MHFPQKYHTTIAMHTNSKRLAQTRPATNLSVANDNFIFERSFNQIQISSKELTANGTERIINGIFLPKLFMKYPENKFPINPPSDNSDATQDISSIVILPLDNGVFSSLISTAMVLKLVGDQTSSQLGF